MKRQQLIKKVWKNGKWVIEKYLVNVPDWDDYPTIIPNFGAGDDSNSGAFNPSSLAGLYLWLVADSLVTTSGSNSVVVWGDLSKNNNNATQSLNSSNAPSVITGALQGHSIVRFDGVNDYLNVPTVGYTSNITIFIVSKKTNITNQSEHLIEPNISSSQFFITGSGDAVTVFNTSFGSTSSYVTTNFNLLSAVRNGSTGSLYGNSIQLSGSIGNIQTGTGTSLIIGGLGTAPSASLFGGDIAEILLYNSALSDPSRHYVETYLNSKYKLY